MSEAKATRRKVMKANVERQARVRLGGFQRAIYDNCPHIKSGETKSSSDSVSALPQVRPPTGGLTLFHCIACPEVTPLGCLSVWHSQFKKKKKPIKYK